MQPVCAKCSLMEDELPNNSTRHFFPHAPNRQDKEQDCRLEKEW